MHSRVLQVAIAAVVLAGAATAFMRLREDESARARAATLSEQASAAEMQTPEDARTASMPYDLPAELAPAEVEHFIADTAHHDANRRSAAIIALARAPKVEAIETLQRIAESGEPTIERPLALRSLRDLALHQGDEDGAIRTIVRDVIYHTDDASVVESAELALEIIEESEMR